jgi:hypothetical protein
LVGNGWRGSDGQPHRWHDPEAAPADVASIDGIVTALYNVISGPAGEQRNWDRFRSLFIPEAKLIQTGFPQGSPTARAQLMTPDDFITGASQVFEQRGFFESEAGHIIERFETIAHVFSTYESRWEPEGEVFQRGINSIQLMWDGQRWWIVNVIWHGVPANTELPERYR